MSCARLAFAGVLLVLLAGCGGKRLVKVEGLVTLDGKPLKGATIHYHPIDSGTPAAGFTEADGIFRLTTYASGDGVWTGEYKVTVTWSPDYMEEQGIPPGTDLSNPSPELAKKLAKAFGAAMMAAQRGTNKNHPKAPPLPADVQDEAKTPLRQKVPPEGKVVLELHSAGR